MKDKSKLVAIILVIITIIVVVGSFILNKSEKKVDNKDISIVTNYSNFYTVNSCLYRVITYLSSKDKDSLMLVIDDNYKKENKVNLDNILSLFPDVSGDSTFVSQKMYYQQITNNITKYYVYGYIEENQFSDYYNGSNKNNKEVYFIVYMDSTSKTFSIEPYSGDIFLKS